MTDAQPVRNQRATDQRDRAAEEVARIRVDLAAAAAGATPLAEIEGLLGDLTRVQPLLEQLAGAVANLLGTDLSVVWTADPVEGVLVPTAWVGFDDDYISAIRVPLGTGSAGRAVQERRTVLIQDVQVSPDYTPWVAGAVAHGVRAVLSVPMLTLGGEAVGALSSYYRQRADPDPRDVELADVYARQAAEIVERARLHSATLQLADLERRRGLQLRALADAALALSFAEDLDALLRLVTEAAVAIVGCHQGVATRLPTKWSEAITFVSQSQTDAAWRGYDVVPDNRPGRLSDLQDAPGHPRLPDHLVAPLVGRDGANLGLVQLSDKLDGTGFTEADESVLVQLAQMASSTIERLEALDRERSARREAEEVARAQSVLSEASAVFAELFEAGGIARALVELAVPRLAELAVLHVVDPEGQVLLADLQTTDPDVAAAAREVLEVFPVELSQPYGPAVALTTGQPQLLPALTRDMIDAVGADPPTAERLAAVVRRSVIAVPLVARGRTLGALSLLRDEPYSPATVAQAVDLVSRAALALDNANRFAFERDVAVTLQRSLLPRSLPSGAGFTAAARYLPGASGTQVGGDWYDVIEVDDALVLVVGDVMGRGVRAAAQMGQLQATVRAYAMEGHSPAEVLSRLDRVVLAVEDLHFTTCAVARLDPRTRTAVLACAGHLPPLLVGPDGAAQLLALDPGLPLGVGGGRFVETEIVLRPGSLLLLYTDGLVEDRGASLDDGLRRLVEGMSSLPQTAELSCARALAALGRDGGHDDDTAVLAVLLPAIRSVELLLPGETRSAGLARHAVRDLVGGPADIAALLTTEVVANAVRHGGGGPVRLRAALSPAGLRVEVDDSASTVPGPPRDAACHEESGRGLMLIDVLASAWGVEPRPDGKCVWFELSDAEPAPAARALEAADVQAPAGGGLADQ